MENDINKNSVTWMFVRKWAMEQLATSRELIENPATDEVTTNVERGAIREMRALLEMGGENTALVEEEQVTGGAEYGLGTDLENLN